MKASELRIGNWVNNNPRDGVITVFSNDKCVIRHKAGIDKAFIEKLEPIPLTEEWLLKFGFKKYPYIRDTFQQVYYDSYQFEIDRFTIVSFSIQQDNKSLIKCNYDRGYRSEDNKKNYYIKYIHQLQNLYFSLTGEELTFKSE